MHVQFKDYSHVELYVRYEGSGSWSESRAKEFLSRLRNNRRVVSRLRNLFGDRRSDPLTDTQLIARAARGIKSGELIMARGTTSANVHATRRFMDPFEIPVLFFLRDKTQPPREPDVVVNACKEILKQEPQLLPAVLQIAPDLGQTVEALLSDRELIAIYHPFVNRVHDGSGTNAAVPAARPSPPPTQERNDPPTFSEDAAVQAQVATLVAAAESGVPFCEMCERERQGRG